MKTKTVVLGVVLCGPGVSYQPGIRALPVKLANEQIEAGNAREVEEEKVEHATAKPQGRQQATRGASRK